MAATATTSPSTRELWPSCSVRNRLNRGKRDRKLFPGSWTAIALSPPFIYGVRDSLRGADPGTVPMRRNEKADASKVVAPSQMLIDERRQHILELVQKQGRVLVGDLSRSLQISQITIRKDLDYLQLRGLIHRSHGGALIGYLYAGNSRQIAPEWISPSPRAVEMTPGFPWSVPGEGRQPSTRPHTSIRALPQSGMTGGVTPQRRCVSAQFSEEMGVAMIGQSSRQRFRRRLISIPNFGRRKVTPSSAVSERGYPPASPGTSASSIRARVRASGTRHFLSVSTGCRERFEH